MKRGSQTYSTRHLTAPVRGKPESAAVQMAGLRIEAERLGINVDRRWGLLRLRHEIAKAKGDPN